MSSDEDESSCSWRPREARRYAKHVPHRSFSLRRCRTAAAAAAAAAPSLASDSGGSDCEVISVEQWQNAAHRRTAGGECRGKRVRSSPGEGNAAKRVKESSKSERRGAKKNKVKQPKRQRTERMDATMEDAEMVNQRSRAKRARSDSSSEGKTKSQLGKKQKMDIDERKSRCEVNKQDGFSEQSSQADVLNGNKSKGVAEQAKSIQDEIMEDADVEEVCVEQEGEAGNSKRSRAPSSAERTAKRQKTAVSPSPKKLGDIRVRRSGPNQSPSSKRQKLEERGNEDSDAEFNFRESVRKSEEFKQAEEQEWRLRQREIERQALEARKLKKKLKAKADRILEMENRQKQRLAEMREHRKQEQNAISAKEQIRSKVLVELEFIASTCKNLAALLQKLGISLGGGHSLTVEQVNIAYKKALLKFHPDRASQGDLKGQVEAEEKFKLISRMKNVLRPL